MSTKGLPIFQNQLSTCEEELNVLVHEIDWALRKTKQDSQTEVAILRSALTDYKKKYDACRTKLKELVKKHEDLKVQFVSMDQNYQGQLAILQEEVTVLKGSFQNWWMEDQKQRKQTLSSHVQEEVAKAQQEKDAVSIVNLEAQVRHWSEQARELETGKKLQNRELQHLESTVRSLTEELNLCKKAMESKDCAQVDVAAIAQRAHDNFLNEEAAYQRNFVASLDAKIERFKQHLSHTSVSS